MSLQEDGRGAPHSGSGRTERPLPPVPNHERNPLQPSNEYEARIFALSRPRASTTVENNQAFNLNGHNHTIDGTQPAKLQPRVSFKGTSSMRTAGSGSETTPHIDADQSSGNDGSRSPRSESARQLEVMHSFYAALDATSAGRPAPGRSRAVTYQSAQRSVRPTGAGYSLSSGNTPLLARASRPRSRPRDERPRDRDNTSEPGEVIVPPWQADASATICPICRTQFSFFVRKHHCRKCGRVVCNACSPHRITIPYQYIVQPPLDISGLPTSQHPNLGHTRAVGSVVVDGLGGGERVRLCNPCVPDPNTAPPQVLSNPSQHEGSHVSSVSTAIPAYSGSGPYQPTAAFESALANFPPRSRQPSTTFSATRTSRSNTSSHGVVESSNGLRPDALGSRSRSSTVGNPSDGLTMGQTTNASYSSSYRPGMESSSLQSHSHSLHPSSSNARPLPQGRRQPRIPEEDECWICHRRLPSRNLENFESLRQKHVEACIAEAMGPSSPTNAPAHQSSRSPSRFVGASSSSAVAAIRPIPIANTPEARMAAREQAHAAVVLGHAQASSSPARRTGVFPYQATEKDCVDDAECTICLEEFEVGVEMGRLECFCRFHLNCIRDWFESRPGQCPVHQHGGGY